MLSSRYYGIINPKNHTTMAKFYNNRVKTGKLAGSVFAVRNGETIERAYQPVVFNPSTPAQVAQRAKLKLMSQLSEVMAPIIAFRKNGAVSARNLFTKKNIGSATYANDSASFPLESIDLTGGILPIGSVTAERIAGGTQCTVSVGNDISRVVFAVFGLGTDEPRFMGSIVATPEGNTATGIVPATLQSRFLVIAYGMRDNTAAAVAKYGDMNVPVTDVNAVLAVMRSLSESDVSLTETTAVIVPAMSYFSDNMSVERA